MHAMQTLATEALGQGNANAVGAQSGKRRLEVLDRMARIAAGFSAGRGNDWH